MDFNGRSGSSTTRTKRENKAFAGEQLPEKGRDVGEPEGQGQSNAATSKAELGTGLPWEWAYTPPPLEATEQFEEEGKKVLERLMLHDGKIHVTGFTLTKEGLEIEGYFIGD